jgi:tetratricopeptide (TPR) repeat protein
MIRSMVTLTALTLLIFLPQPAQAGWDEGVAAFRAGNYAQAIKEFEALVQTRQDCAPCHLMLGQSLLASKRNAEAVTHLRKAYDLNPNDVSVWLPLAQSYVGAKRYDDALQLLRSVDVNSLPKERHQAFYQLRASALEKSGRGEQATDDLRRAAQANPKDAAAQYAFGLTALSSRDVDAAIPALEAAVRLDGKDADKKRALVRAHLLKGRQSQGPTKQRAYQQAAEVAQQLVAASGSFDHLMLLGESQLGAKQYDAAVGTFDRATKANAGDWLALYYLGQARTTRGQFDQAERDLKNALGKAKSAQDQALIWRQLAFVYEKQRNFDDAKLAYRKIGDQAAAARVEENERIARENREVEEYNQQVEEIEAQRQRLREEMGDLPPNW